MLNLIYFVYHFWVYLKNELPQLAVLKTYLDPSVFNEPNKFSDKIIVKHQLGFLREIKDYSLEGWELEIFRETYFRNFMDLDMHWTFAS